jgi:hypothetical protein
MGAGRIRLAGSNRISTRLKNGTCNQSQAAPLAAQQQEIAAVGQVSLH